MGVITSINIIVIHQNFELNKRRVGISSRKINYSVLFTGNVARTGRRQLVDVNEDSLLGIAGIEGKHPLVNVLLQTFAAVARGQGTTGCTREQASFDAMGLGVSGPGDFLDDDPPFSIDIHCPKWASINDIAWADVSLVTRPVAFLEEFAFVVGVVEVFLSQRGQSIDQIVGRLIGKICVFLQHQPVVIDGVLKRNESGKIK